MYSLGFSYAFFKLPVTVTRLIQNQFFICYLLELKFTSVHLRVYLYNAVLILFKSKHVPFLNADV